MTDEFIGPELLRTLLTVAETGGFTSAAQSLSIRQSTVSQQIKRLEEIAGRRLLDRNTHGVSVTPEGQAMLEHARRVLTAYELMNRHVSTMSIRGRLRFGACEDFVLSALPDVLAAFAQRFPTVDVELTSALSAPIYEGFDTGAFDIILVKRRQRDPRGIVAWSEPVAWLSRPDMKINFSAPLPLLLYPPPSFTRRIAIEALERARMPWRVAFTSDSLSGLRAAARAGIGIMPHSVRLLPPGLGVMKAAQLPKLPSIEFVVLRASQNNTAAAALSDAILQWVEQAEHTLSVRE